MTRLRVLLILISVMVLFAFSLYAQTNYFVRLADSTYAAKLVGKTGSPSAGLTIYGAWVPSMKVHGFSVTKTGRYDLWIDIAGGLGTYAKDTFWSGSYGKLIPGSDQSTFYGYLDILSRVKSIGLGDSSISTAKLKDLSVTNAKLGANAVTTGKILDSTIAMQDISRSLLDYIGSAGGDITNMPDEITLTKSGDYLMIKDGGVSEQHIGIRQVSHNNIGNNEVYRQNIDDGAVGTDQLADTSVTWAKLHESVKDSVRTGAGAGTITGVTAGDGLSGGGTSGNVTLDIGEGFGIETTAGTIYIDSSLVSTRYWVQQTYSPPGGSNTHIQYNDSGSLAGDDGFVYNDATERATVTSIAAGSQNYFDTNTTDTNQDGLKLTSSADLGVGEKGASISFTENNGSGRKAAIVAVQTGSDKDQMGLYIYTHPDTASASALVGQVFIDHNGNVSIGTDVASGRFFVDNGGFRAADSFSVGAGAIWVRDIKYFSGDSSLGFTFWNSSYTPARLDTAYLFQHIGAGGAGTGDITGVVAGLGLLGGATDGTATLDADTTVLAHKAWVSNVVSDSILSYMPLKQDVSDTSSKDATRYWVQQQGYGLGGGDITAVTAGDLLTGGGIADSVHVKLDTLKAATRYWVGQQGYGDITGITTPAADWLTGGASSGSPTLKVDTTKAASNYDLTLKQSVSDTSVKDATRYWVGQQGYLTSEVGDISSIIAADGLTGTTYSGSATISVGAGYGIEVTDNAVKVDTTTAMASKLWSTHSFQEDQGIRFRKDFLDLRSAIHNGTGAGVSGYIFGQPGLTDVVTVDSIHHQIDVASGTQVMLPENYQLTYDKTTAVTGISMFSIADKKNIVFDGGTLDYSADVTYGDESDEIFWCGNDTNVTIKNMILQNSPGDGIYISSGKRYTIDNCKIYVPNLWASESPHKYVGRQAISLVNGYSANDTLQQVKITNCVLTGGIPGAIDIEPNGTGKIKDILIDNCSFVGLNRTGVGLLLSIPAGVLVENIIVSNCTFENLDNGIYITNGGTLRNVQINNCIVKNCNVGYYLRYQADDVKLNNCTADSCDYGFRSYNVNRNVEFKDCKALNNKYTGFFFDDADPTTGLEGVRIDGCTIKDNGDRGAHVTYSHGILSEDADNVTILNSTFDNNYGYSIKFQGGDNIIMSNNHFLNNGANSPYVTGCTDVTESNNSYETINATRVFDGSSIIWSGEKIPSGTDSSLTATFPSGQPTLTWLSAAGGNWNISTAGDTAKFNGASGGYKFDRLIQSTLPAPVVGLDLGYNSIDNVRDLVHEEATDRDFYISNADADKSTWFRILQGATPNNLLELRGSDGTIRATANTYITGDHSVSGSLSVGTDMIFVGKKTATFDATQGMVWISGDTLLWSLDGENTKYWVMTGTFDKH